jgi:hypothetical protein
MQLPFAGKRTVPRAIQSRFPLLLSPVLKKSPAISSLLGILYPELQPALRIKTDNRNQPNGSHPMRVSMNFAAPGSGSRIYAGPDFRAVRRHFCRKVVNSRVFSIFLHFYAIKITAATGGRIS